MTALENPRAIAGANNPPSPIDMAKITFDALAEYLKNRPVVQTLEEAKEAKLFIDRAKASLDELEKTRDGIVRPLNEKVKGINAEFREAREPLEKLLNEVKARLDRFIDAEEKRRAAEARAAQEALAEKERLAREAEARETEAKEGAEVGEFTDVGAATLEADAAFAEMERAQRAAEIAERDSAVKIVGGFGRALSRRTTEELIIEDAAKAIKAILKERGGILPEKIADAIKTAARDYRKAKGKLPDGVTSETSRSL
jgi:hypothetical protein